MRNLIVVAVLAVPVLVAGCKKGPEYEGKSVSQHRKALKDPSAEVRSKAAASLGEMGVEAKDAVPDLIKALKDADPEVRTNAMHALWSMEAHANSAYTDIVAALQEDTHAPVRVAAVGVLSDFNPKVGDIITPLSRALVEDTNAEVRLQAAKVFSKLERKAKEAVPSLIKALRDKDIKVRDAAVYALAEMGPDGRAAIPTLQGMANQKSLADPEAVAEALDRLQGKR